MPEKKESARATIILAVCAVALGFYAIPFGVQTLVCIETHRWAVSYPFLKAVPQPPPTAIAAPIQEKDLELYGFTFSAPWKGPAKKTEGDAESRVDFPSGAVVVFFNPANEANIVGSIRDGDPSLFDSYQAIFGTGFFSNDYAMYSAVYGAAPNQARPFTSRSKAVRINTLLTWKLRFGMYGKDTVYSIQTNDMRGFQLGDPSRDQGVMVQLFDAKDGQLRILFTSKSGQPGTIPQADINCVVQSLKPPSFAR